MWHLFFGTMEFKCKYATIDPTTAELVCSAVHLSPTGAREEVVQVVGAGDGEDQKTIFACKALGVYSGTTDSESQIKSRCNRVSLVKN